MRSIQSIRVSKIPRKNRRLWTVYYPDKTSNNDDRITCKIDKKIEESNNRHVQTRASKKTLLERKNYYKLKKPKELLTVKKEFRQSFQAPSLLVGYELSIYVKLILIVLTLPVYITAIVIITVSIIVIITLLHLFVLFLFCFCFVFFNFRK